MHNAPAVRCNGTGSCRSRCDGYKHYGESEIVLARGELSNRTSEGSTRGLMAVCRVDPIIDQRWQALIERHRDAGIFHTSGWLEALRRTYGYEPVAYAIERGQELVNGIPFCRIRSWFTGRRLVSLPFSDHCQPLVESYLELKELLSSVQEDAAEQRCKYFEIRPLILEEPHVPAEAKVTKNSGALIHRLDLRPSQEDIFRGFHKQVVRKIARSERERVSYEEGRSEELLSKFYRLLLLTRRRHQLPPQPLVWFRNLIDCLGPRLKIRVASKDDTPIASIITLSFKGVVTYKYGCSDASFNPLGGTTLLFWRTIQDAKAEGASDFDLGRSDYETPGLIAFKDHWGAARFPLTYHRCPATPERLSARRPLGTIAKSLIAKAPDPVLAALGDLLYRHVG